MKKTLLFVLLLMSIGLFSQSKPIELKSEHLINPIGIDAPQPRFTWKMQDDRKGAKQTAYQIIVDTDSMKVLSNNGSVWRTSKVANDKSLVVFGGRELQPFTRYYWRVLVWDKDNKETRSDIASFETGMMGMHNWQGTWIDDGHNIHYKPAPYFRKVFENKKEVKSARAYIAVAGLYELYINGDKIGNHRLDPMYTRFDRRNYYVTHDVTQQLKNGNNAIGVILGNGWYNHQSSAVWDFDVAHWRDRPRFCLDLHITYTDGTTEVISTESDWRTSSGPITSNSIYTAEHYDARLEIEGWNTPNFDDSSWHGSHKRKAPSANITAQQIEPIRNVEEIAPQELKKFDNQTYVFDLGRNIAGVTKVRIEGEEGTEVRIKHAERLHDNGRVDMSNIDVYHRPKDESDPFQTDILILSGKGKDEFMARFNYKGFRYVEVTSSKPIQLDKSSIAGYFMHSDVEPIGYVAGSNSIINKLWWVTNNAYLSNLMGYPTDCPQREKNGWTGDGHFAIETALYNFDGITVYEKWLADHRDEQQPNGVLPDIIPTGGWGYGGANGLDWTSTIAIIPWEIYRFYGDSRLLEECYLNIKSYVDYVDRISDGHLTSFGRGDWVPVKSHSNLELTSSTYFYVDATILAKAAKLFGKDDDYKYYSTLARNIKDAINNKYLNKESGVYANGTQTELSVPLQWGVVPEDMKQKIADNLATKVKEANFHLDVGVLGAKALLNALSENGHAETAYKVAVQDTYPSWGWWVVNGATTLLENWDLDATRDISDNHMMFGEIGAWFYKGLGGIFPDEHNPGFKHIILRPNFVSSLNESEAKFKSPYGEIISNWSRNKNNITYEVTIPANTSATFYVPENIKGKKYIKLEAGKYILKLEEKKNTEKESHLYKNPVVPSSLPDPTIIKAKDGSFYLYATEDTRNVPIHKSENLIDWKFVSTAFTDESRPTFEPRGGIWAPDIEYVNGKYHLYYSMSVWGGEQTCGIGVAVADKPEGPFTDKGKIFRSNEIGVTNSIDQFYIEENGRKYLFWGSFRGIYAIELAEDGLTVKDGAEKVHIAGTAFEGVYIYKRGDYYYLFASIGTCCEGVNSTYQLVVGRSKSLFGTYVDKSGKEMKDNGYNLVIGKSNRFVGNGHCSEIVQDKENNDWIFYHGVDVTNPNGRVLLLDQILWDENDWPYVKNNVPSEIADSPVF